MSGYVYGIPRVAAPARRRRPDVAGVLATAAGHVLRFARRGVVFVPEAAGAVSVSFGAWLAWEPAGFVVAGVFLLMLGRRVS